jgi:hypothetical protein
VPTGNGVRIVVVDSGVNPLHSHVGGRIDGASIYRGKDGAVHRERITGHDRSRYRHRRGDRHVAPEADLFVLKIFNGALATTPDVLEGALTYAPRRGRW